MKKLRYFCVLLLGILFSVSSFAQKTKITPEIFLSLSLQEQREVVLMLMKTVAEMEGIQKERGIKNKSKFTWNEQRKDDLQKIVKLFNSLLIESAHAFTGNDSEIGRTCLYGGWKSTVVKFGNELYCTHPQSSKVLTFSKDYNTETPTSCKGVNTISCNPQLFGHPILCVAGNTDAANSSASCYQKVINSTTSDLNKRLDGIIAKLKTNGCATLRELLDLIYKICACGNKKLPVATFSEGYANYMSQHRTCLALLGQTRNILKRMKEKSNEVSCIDGATQTNYLTTLEKYFEDFDSHILSKFKSSSANDLKKIGGISASLDTHQKKLVSYFGENCEGQKPDEPEIVTTNGGNPGGTVTAGTTSTSQGSGGSDGTTSQQPAEVEEPTCEITKKMTPEDDPGDGKEFTVELTAVLTDSESEDISDKYTACWYSTDPAVNEICNKSDTKKTITFTSKLEESISIEATFEDQAANKEFKCTLEIEKPAPKEEDETDDNDGVTFEVKVKEENDDDYLLEGIVTAEPPKKAEDYIIKWKHGKDSGTTVKKKEPKKIVPKGVASTEEEEDAPKADDGKTDDKKEEVEEEKTVTTPSYKKEGKEYKAPREAADYEACADFIKAKIVIDTKCTKIPKKETKAAPTIQGNPIPGFQPMPMPQSEIYNQGLN